MLIGQKVINKVEETLEVIDVRESDNLKGMMIKLDNEKSYNLYLCYKNHYLRFVNEGINKELDDYLLKEEKDINDIKRINEEVMNKKIKENQIEKEKRENSIDSFRDEYSFLSNFYICNVTYDGFTYTSSESAFQGQKDLSRREEFTKYSPLMSKKIGKRVKLRSDWEEIKLSLMEEIVRCKFDQNPDLKEKLLSTGDRLLIEGNTWGDYYWGVCKGKGENHLGKILMKLRKEYKS